MNTGVTQESKLFDLPSGAKLKVPVASFANAWALTKATLRSLKGLSLSEGDLTKEFSSFGAAAASVPALLDRIISFATSEEVETAVFKCADRALYVPVGAPADMAGLRVNRDLFDDMTYGISAREDYAMIVARILEVNCKPFLAKALSALSAPTRAATTSSGPESKTS